jgi:hypothetical protein
MTRQATVAELERWQDNGATWRVLELHDQRIMLQLCSCSGEPMDLVESQDPEVIAYVRHRPPEF